MAESQKTSTEVVPFDESAEVSGLAAIEPTHELVEQAYAAISDGELPPEIGDPAIVARLIQERIRRGTLEESMEPTESLPNWAQTYPEVPVTVLGFHMNRSTKTETEGVYAVVEIMDPDGELVTVQTGGQNVLTQLVKAWETGKYPFRAVMNVQTTGQNRTILWLRKPEQ